MLLQQLQSFHILAETGSLSRASARTQLSPAVLTQQVKALEHELGTPLFNREDRGFSLTPAGELLYQRSAQLLSEMDQMVREVRQMVPERGEKLRIGYLSCYGGAEFQRAVSAFARKHPEVELEILNGSREELYDAIHSGTVNLVLNDQRRFQPEDYVHYELVKSRCYVEIPPQHPLACRKRLEPECLQNGRCILVAGAAHRQAEQAYYRESIGFQGEFLFARSLQEARHMVASGQGFLPVEGVGESEECAECVARIPLYQQDRPVLRNYCAFWRTDHSTALVEEFASLLREQFAT